MFRKAGVENLRYYPLFYGKFRKAGIGGVEFSIRELAFKPMEP